MLNSHSIVCEIAILLNMTFFALCTCIVTCHWRGHDLFQ